MGANVAIPRQRLVDFCRRNHIRRLSLFGSVLNADFRAESDVDILVEFEAGQIPGLAFIDMQKELSDLLGRSVDLHTLSSLSRYFRDTVRQEAEPLYVVS